MWKSLIAAVLIILSLNLYGCSSKVSGLQSYVDSLDGYEFLYPNGWMQVDVKEASEGVDVVFRDLIERSENLSVIVSDIPEGKSLAEIGTPTEVGYRFLKQINADPNSNRQAELIDAEIHDSGAKTYYILEYQVKSPNNLERHDIASVTTNRGKLFTFNLSTRQSRWLKVKDLFEVIVNSFQVY